MSRITLKVTLQVLLFALLLSLTRAWGKDGHEMVGNLAYRRLSNDTKAWVKRILKANTSLSIRKQHHDYNNTILGQVADWADEVRFTKEYHWTTPLHYIDIRDDQIQGGCPSNHTSLRVGVLPQAGCRFVYKRDCVNDFCVAGAIANYTQHLSNWTNAECHSFLRGPSATSTTPTQESLMFLTHYVGDIHQPLHSARTTDKGGNTFHVEFIFSCYSGMESLLSRYGTSHWNLHSVWDSGIIEAAIQREYNSSRADFEQDLLEMIQQAEINEELQRWLSCTDGTSKACSSVWAEESFEAALEWAYRNVDGTEVQSGATLGKLYYESRLPIVKKRLAMAGARLAAVLTKAASKDGGIAVQ